MPEVSHLSGCWSVLLAYVIDQSAAPDLDVLGVEGILQKLYDVVTDGVLAVESLGPGEELSLVKCGLLNGETVEGQRNSRSDKEHGNG